MKNIEKLPSFETAKLSKFVFGDPEAKSDEILASCFQPIRGVEEFLGGSKSIVLGERGSGKSALFKLISDGTLEFKYEPKDKPRKLVVVPIDDDLEYLSIANVVEERFSDNIKRRHGKYRYLWEIYILSRIIDRIQEEHSDDLEVNTLRDDFGEILGLPKKKGFRLRDLLTAYKLTVGGKIDPTGSVTPTFSIEPARNAHDTTSTVTDKEIGLLKERLKKQLKSKSTVAIVLVDRIDDFVVGMAYEEQLKNIQALVDCIKDFRLPEMKLKVFLRTDLFNRLSFDHGGFDKLAPQIVRLEWTSKDICEFVARRLLYNYKRQGIGFSCTQLDLSLLDLDPAFQEQLRSVLQVRANSIPGLLKAIFQLLKMAGRIKLARMKRKSHTARRTDLVHAIVMKVITLVFPERVDHNNGHCQREPIPIENFLATHFTLGGDNPNPRLVMLFLGFTFEQSAYYYSRNPDKELLPANDLNEYELILKEHILAGYEKLQNTARNTVAHLNPERRKYVERLFSGLGKPAQCRSLDFGSLKRLTGWDLSDTDFHSFVAFFTHIGLLVPDNPTLPFTERSYSFPLIMMKCSRTI
jgi:hypothetical protein